MAQQIQRRFLAQPQQNPKPANCIEETHEQVQAITTLKSGNEIDKTIAPKEVNHGKVGEFLEVMKLRLKRVRVKKLNLRVIKSRQIKHLIR